MRGLSQLARSLISAFIIGAVLMAGAAPARAEIDPVARGLAAKALGQVASAAQVDRFSQPPTVFDNTSRSYATTSVWQAQGQLYQPTYVDAISATWVPLTPAGAGIVDIMGSANVPFAGGTVAMKAGYTGAAIDISVTLAATPTTKTINILPNGELDALTLQSWIAAADTGTIVTVTKLYDQSGAGNHAVLGSYNGMRIEWDPALQRYALVGDVSTTANRALSIPSTVTVSSITNSMWAMGRGVNSAGNFAPTVGTLGTWSGGSGPFMILSSTALPSLDSNSSSGGAISPPANVPMDLNPVIVGVVNTSTTRAFWVNEETSTKTWTPGTQTYTGGSIGTSGIDATRNPSMRYIGFAITSTTPTTAQAQAIRYAAYVRMNIRPQVRNQVVFVGDSRMMGFASLDGPNLPMAVADRLKVRAKVINASVSGWSSANFQSGMLTGVNAIYKSNARNIAVYMSGVNDFIVDNVSPATAASRIAANVATLKAGGWTVILISELATTNVTNSANTQLAALRALLNTPGATSADLVVDFSGYTPAATPSNTLYYPDGLHGSAGLYSMMAGVIAPKIDAYLLGS